MRISNKINGSYILMEKCGNRTQGRKPNAQHYRHQKNQIKIGTLMGLLVAL